jgi:ABC-type polysaccharide/polyol phosphate transport system ATPase subunit
VAVAVRTDEERESQRAHALAAAPPAVVVRNLRKSFRIPHHMYSTLKERVLHPFASRTFEELKAVDDISFDVQRGEFFGIVGRNGSGKSTLLKMLAGIYEPDEGTIEIDGRLSPFIELGVGFNPDLAARDNVAINAVMLGLTRKQAMERFDDIIRFAELEEFVDLKLKNYSSGMSVRLAFSTAIEADADVLLVDEVLAVGDAAFQHKCFEEFQRMKDAGRTMILVTHDMGAVQRFCDRAMLIERGRVVEMGDPEKVARAYNEINFGRLVFEPEGDEARYGDHVAAEIVDAWFENAVGHRLTAQEQGDDLVFAMAARINEPLTDPIFAVTIRNSKRHSIFGTSSAAFHGPTGAFKAGDIVDIKVRLENILAADTYTATPSIAHAGTGQAAIDVREDMARVIIHSTKYTGGVVDLPHEWEIAARP